MFQGVEIEERAEQGCQSQGEVGQRASLKKTKMELISSLVDNLKQHFPQIELLDAMQLYVPKAYLEDIVDVDRWGCDHLDTLLKHFGEGKMNVDGIQCG